MRTYQYVDDVWVGESHNFAERLIKHYATGGSPRSRERSGNRGTESDLRRQWQGKTGECAFAIHIGQNPADAVKWHLAPDQGADVRLPDGQCVDVKTTPPRYKLIWSNNVNDLYQKKSLIS